MPHRVCPVKRSKFTPDQFYLGNFQIDHNDSSGIQFL